MRGEDQVGGWRVVSSQLDLLTSLPSSPPPTPAACPSPGPPTFYPNNSHGVPTSPGGSRLNPSAPAWVLPPTQELQTATSGDMYRQGQPRLQVKDP